MSERIYRCSCGSLEHIMALWVDEENACDGIDISMVIPWMPRRWRIKQAWRVLRGDPGTSTFVWLTREDARRLRDDLSAIVSAEER